jgi:hypothetical protein
MKKLNELHNKIIALWQDNPLLYINFWTTSDSEVLLFIKQNEITTTQQGNPLLWQTTAPDSGTPLDILIFL